MAWPEDPFREGLPTTLSPRPNILATMEGGRLILMMPRMISSILLPGCSRPGLGLDTPPRIDLHGQH